MNASYFQTLARYNAWANRRLYAACGALPEDAYLRERPSFFGSIHKTLNHILVVDRLWLSRFQKTAGAPNKLDQLQEKNFAGLNQARAAEDRRILEFTAGLTDAGVAAVLHYTNLKGQPSFGPMVLYLAHVFNHQTHHRGQVHGLLSQDMKEPPSLDIFYFMPEDGARAT